MQKRFVAAIAFCAIILPLFAVVYCNAKSHMLHCNKEARNEPDFRRKDDDVTNILSSIAALGLAGVVAIGITAVVALPTSATEAAAYSEFASAAQPGALEPIIVVAPSEFQLASR